MYIQILGPYSSHITYYINYKNSYKEKPIRFTSGKKYIVTIKKLSEQWQYKELNILRNNNSINTLVRHTSTQVINDKQFKIVGRNRHLKRS